MSLLSRSTGGRRATARMAAVFAGTLLMYIVATALPAAAANPAVSRCFSSTSGVAANDIVDIEIHADDVVAVRVAAGLYEISVNGSAFDAASLGANACPATATTGAVDFMRVIGSDSGAETFIFFHPADFGTINSSVDLGNGTDTVRFDYGSFSFVDGTPLIVDPASADNLSLGVAADGTLVGDFTAIAGAADGKFVRTETFIVNGGGGDDELDAGTAASSATSTIAGYTQDDIPAMFAPFPLGTTLNGGTGDDNLVSGDGDDVFLGGPGDDSVDYSFASGPAVIDLAASTGSGQGNDVLSDVQDAMGSEFDDSITGSSTDNDLDGNDGDDHINGGAGNDTVMGGLDGADADSSGGDDHLLGGAGNDIVDGQDGDDVIDEEAAANGADSLIGGTGDEVDGDTLDHSARTTAVAVTAGVGAGNDGENLNADTDASDVGEEGDTVAGDFENYLGGSGADYYSGSGANEMFTPNGGNDFVDGNAAAGDILDISEATTDVTVDLPNGTANGNGTDTFEQIEGVATGTGNDTVLWDGLTPFVDFFSDGGDDTVDASQALVGVTINLATLGNGQEVENAIGGEGNDTITGNVLGNWLAGNGGVDTILGGNGNDVIDGGLGNDTLSGQAGADTLWERDATGGVIVDNQLGFTDGALGQDAISFFEIILGSNFDDEIIAGQTSFGLNQRILGFQGDDIIIGSNSSDLLKAGKGDDDVRAGGGDDDIRLSGGNDVGIGGGGSDIIWGGAGVDEGRGGPGFDRCKGVEFAVSC